MAFFNKVMYLNWGNGGTTGYFALPQRAASTAYTVGTIVRPATAPTFGNEKAFICTTAGTTSAAGDASWSTGTRGVNVTDGTVTWHECSGHPAVNGDKVNTPSWAEIKAIGGSASRGTIIKRNSGTSYHFTTGGTPGASEPAFSDTVGSTVADGSCTWTCLGLTATFPAIKAPHSRWVNAHSSSWVVEGGTIYIANTHNEVSTTQFNTSSTGSLLLYKIICHNAAGSYPPTPADITTGARIESTSGSGISFSFWGSYYIYGVTFVSPSNSFGTTIQGSYLQNWGYLDACSLQTNTAGGTISLAGNAADWFNIIWNNCTVKFLGAAGYIMVGNAQWIWQNTGLILESGSAVPSWLVSMGSSIYGGINTVVLNRLDMSQLSGKLYASYNDNKPSIGVITVQDCALHPSMVLTPHKWPGQFVQIIRSSSGRATNTTNRYSYEGNETTETSITRVGGAADPIGNHQSRKITVLANTEWTRPYKAEPYAAWNSTVGAPVAVSVYGGAYAGQVLDDEVWAEFEYLGSASAPLGAVATTAKANILAAGTPYPADSSAWSNVDVVTFTTVTGTVITDGLTATHGSTNGAIGATTWAYLKTGKYYFEIKIAAAPSASNYLGLLAAAATFADMQAGLNCVAFYGASASSIWSNNVNQNLDVGPATNGGIVGDVFCFAVDLTARLGWIRKNNGNWNANASANPASGVGGFTIAPGISFTPAIGFRNPNSGSTAYTLNVGDSAYAQAQPSGFLNWKTGWTPFKLTKTITPGLPGYVHARVRAVRPNAIYYIDPKIEFT